MKTSATGTRSTRSRLAVVAATALLSLGLAACGGDDEALPEGEASTLEEVAALEGAAVLMDAQALTALDQPIEYPKKKKAQISSELEVLEPGQESASTGCPPTSMSWRVRSASSTTRAS